MTLNASKLAARIARAISSPTWMMGVAKVHSADTFGGADEVGGSGGGVGGADGTVGAADGGAVEAGKRHFTGRETVKHSTKNQNRSPG